MYRSSIPKQNNVTFLFNSSATCRLYLYIVMGWEMNNRSTSASNWLAKLAPSLVMISIDDGATSELLLSWMKFVSSSSSSSSPEWMLCVSDVAFSAHKYLMVFGSMEKVLMKQRETQIEKWGREKKDKIRFRCRLQRTIQIHFHLLQSMWLNHFWFSVMYVIPSISGNDSDSTIIGQLLSIVAGTGPWMTISVHVVIILTSRNNGTWIAFHGVT